MHEHEVEPHGLRPEIWVYCEGGSAELDPDGLDAHIRDVESHLLQLRKLRLRYVTLLQGAELVGKAGGDADTHPARTGVRCPFWCDARTYSRAARSGTGHVHVGLARRTSDEVWISLRHNPFERLPEIDLTVTAPGQDPTARRLTLTEATQLRENLGELIASAEACAPPRLLAMDTLLSDMGAQVVEDSRLTACSSGYVLRDVAPGGRVTVAVPGGLTPDRRDGLVRKLLSDIAIDTSCVVPDDAATPQLFTAQPPFVVTPGSAA
ncbi:hypothetical protein R6V09_40290 [Streptomyces sp. W16]|nr:hypothetical protein [Streptomyces sp. W16]MDV9176352.1 hypothetical protein [Streptomyces sp. W16]